MKKTDFIVMLTLNDITVQNAAKLFEQCKDLPVQHWGFKDVGLPQEERIALGRHMKDCGKIVHYELVDYSDESYRNAVEVSSKMGAEYLSGGYFCQWFADALKEVGVNYLPTTGKLLQEEGKTAVLVGEPEQLLEDAKSNLSRGAYGLEFSPFRHQDGIGEELLQMFRTQLPQAHICVAGNVATFERMETLCRIGADSFTMGSALFKEMYAPGQGFKANLAAVAQHMERITS